MGDIFISYAREDLDEARLLATALETEGWSVFWDREIPPGQTWRSYIGKALESADCVVVAWSKASIDSDWVQEEADDAKSRSVLVPVLFEAVTPPIGFRAIQAADLAGWNGDIRASSFATLRIVIAQLLGEPPLDKNLAALLEVEKNRCRERNVPFLTPNLLLALIGPTRKVFDGVNSGIAEQMLQGLGQYVPESAAGFADFEWGSREEVQAARRHARREGVRETSARHLLLGFLDTPSETRNELQRTLGKEGFERLRVLADARNDHGTPGVRGLFDQHDADGQR